MLESERETLCELGRTMIDEGLTRGVGGNLSQRGAGDRIAITPSGVPYHEIDPADVPVVTTDGEYVAGEAPPSSETPMHTMVYRTRSDVGGIAHTHSPYATTFAALGRPIPASHYLIAYVGQEVPVTGYEPPGTEALGRAATAALGERYDACLLRNHGVLAVGDDAAAALETALMVEFCARIHYQAVSIGDPIVLDEDTVEELIVDMEEYRRSD